MGEGGKNGGAKVNKKLLIQEKNFIMSKLNRSISEWSKLYNYKRKQN